MLDGTCFFANATIFPWNNTLLIVEIYDDIRPTESEISSVVFAACRDGKQFIPDSTEDFGAALRD